MTKYECWGQVAKSAASITQQQGRRGVTHLGNIAPKPASVGKPRHGLLASKGQG